MIHEKIGKSKSAASERTEEHEAIEDDRKRTGMISWKICLLQKF